MNCTECDKEAMMVCSVPGRWDFEAYCWEHWLEYYPKNGFAEKRTPPLTIDVINQAFEKAALRELP